MRKRILPVRIKTDSDRIAFAVRFASEPVLDSKTFVKRLRRDLTMFLGMERRSGKKEPGGFGIEVNALRAPHPWEFTVSQLRELQEDARHMIDHAVDGRGLAPTTISDEQDVIVDVVGQPGNRTLRIGGSVRAGFLLTLALLLAGVTDAPSVLKCPECGRLFLRSGRQKYCQDECTDRALWKNYPVEKKLKARKKVYEANNWKLGARSKQTKQVQGSRARKPTLIANRHSQE
jgi:hypothetical protein